MTLYRICILAAIVLFSSIITIIGIPSDDSNIGRQKTVIATKPVEQTEESQYSQNQEQGSPLSEYTKKIDGEDNWQDEENHPLIVSNVLANNVKLAQWVTENGYLPKELIAESEYDDAMLDAESRSGNIYAQQLIAERLLKQKKYREAEPILFEAASRGSTKAIIMMAELNLSLAQNFPDYKREATETAAAWLLVGEKRGDPMSKMARQFFSLDVVISGEGLDVIQNKSNAIYQTLENKRIASGSLAFSDTAFPGDDLTIFQYLH